MSWARSARRVASVGFGRAAGDPVADLVQPAQADAARDGLAAGRVRREPGQEAGEVDHAGPLVGDHDGSGADVGAGRAQGVELVGGVEEVCGEQAAGGAAHEHRLERPRAGAAGEVHELPQRGAQGDLGDARARGTPELDEDGAGAGRRAGRPEHVAPVGHDPGDRGQGLDVVDDRGPLEQAPLRGVRRTLVRLAAPALQGLDEDGLLAQHVGALHRPHGDGHAMAGARGVVAQEARLLGGEDGALEPGHERRIVPPDGEDGLGGADGEGGDGGALDDAPWVCRQEGGVGPDRGVGAVAVRDDVALVRGLRGGGSPLLAGVEARATPATEPGRGDRGDRPRGAQVAHGQAQAPEGALADRGVEVEGIGLDGGGAAEEDRRPPPGRRQEGVHQPAPPPKPRDASSAERYAVSTTRWPSPAAGASTAGGSKRRCA